MNYYIAARSEYYTRIESPTGASATLFLKGSSATAACLRLPEEDMNEEGLTELLSAVEKAAIHEGANKLRCDCSFDIPGLEAALKTRGYELDKKEELLSVNTEELLSSAAVVKSLRTDFADIQTDSFKDIISFQWGEISGALNHYHYPSNDDDFERFDHALSYVAYDKLYTPRSVLLATTDENRILIELLMGFSGGDPRYILSVCQAFAASLMRQELHKDYERIYVLSVNESVLSLLKRLLDKKYKIQHEDDILIYSKKLAGKDGDMTESIINNSRIHLWRKETEDGFARRNISEKIIWKSRGGDKWK